MATTPQTSGRKKPASASSVRNKSQKIFRCMRRTTHGNWKNPDQPNTFATGTSGNNIQKNQHHQTQPILTTFILVQHFNSRSKLWMPQMEICCVLIGLCQSQHLGLSVELAKEGQANWSVRPTALHVTVVSDASRKRIVTAEAVRQN